MKIDLEVYKVILDVRKLISQGLFQINDIEDLGFGDFLEILRDMDLSILKAYKNMINDVNKIGNLRPGTKLEGVKNVLAYSSLEELKKDLIYLPSVNHERSVFDKTKNKMDFIYKENPEILYDITENGWLIGTINGLVEKYNMNENKNQNV